MPRKVMPPKWWLWFIPVYFVVWAVLYALGYAIVHGELPAWYK